MIITNTHCDWWQWSWRQGGHKPQSVLDNWVFEPRPYDFQKPQDMRDAMEITLSKIASQNDRLVLFYSGGVDSESILTIACEQGIDITPVFLRFTNNLNQHEEYHVIKTAEQLGITVKIIDIDIESWLHTDRSEFSWYHINSEWGLQHPVPGVLIWLRHQIAQTMGDVTVIHGSGDLPIYGFQDPLCLGKKVWTINYCWQANFQTLEYYYENYPKDVPYFYSYTPELVYGQMSDFERYNLMTPSVVFSSNCRSRLFQKLFPEQTPRKKYHGWEYVWRTISDVPRYALRPTQNPEPYSYIDYEEFYALLRTHAR